MICVAEFNLLPQDSVLLIAEGLDLHIVLECVTRVLHVCDSCVTRRVLLMLSQSEFLLNKIEKKNTVNLCFGNHD